MQVKIVSGDVETLSAMLNRAIADAYKKGQQAERERIKEVIRAIGPRGRPDAWFDCVDTILERIDDL